MDNVLSWRYEFFTKGHTMNEIDNLCYWDFIGVTEYQNKSNDRADGKTVYKELKPSQKQMIEDRKKKEQARKNG